MRMRPGGRKRRQQEAERVFTPDPIPRPAGPPASSAPLQDYLATARPGADANYVVLPRSLVEAMPLPWQQHLTYLLAEFHQAFAHVPWPIYRVQPSRHEQLTDLDEEQLAEAGYLVEIDPDGELVYRDRSGRVVERPAAPPVLGAGLAPTPPPHPPGQGRPTGPRPAPATGHAGQERPISPRPEPPTGRVRSDPSAGRARPEPDPDDTPPRGMQLQPPFPPQQPGPFGPQPGNQPRW
jgi:hypothetical protein